jgi:hypothetical protein
MTIRTPQDQDEVDVRCRCESILLKSTLTPPRFLLVIIIVSHVPNPYNLTITIAISPFRLSIQLTTHLRSDSRCSINHTHTLRIRRNTRLELSS